MGIIDEIKQMQSQGKSEQEIASSLKQRGVSDSEINEAIAQNRIKDAVSSDDPLRIQQGYDSFNSFQGQEPAKSAEYSDNKVGYEGMQPSLLGFQDEQNNPTSQVAQERYLPNEQAYSEYGQYQPYQEAISSDVISEISEQIVSEKLSFLYDKLEKIFSFMNSSETRITNIDERIRRVEKILDVLQLSLLQKVGDYVSDVKDMKKELEETQKSFKTLVYGHRGGGQGIKKQLHP
ncbi:MAG: hypothetical protein AABX73_01975 [Nanoarchaeota archaeon]